MTEAQKRAQTKYRQSQKAKDKTALFSIRTNPQKKQAITELLKQHGYTVSDFFNYCVELLKVGAIPNRPTEWQSPSQRMAEHWRNYRKTDTDTDTTDNLL